MVSKSSNLENSMCKAPIILSGQVAPVPIAALSRNPILHLLFLYREKLYMTIFRIYPTFHLYFIISHTEKDKQISRKLPTTDC